jgi:hypothetical protein
MLTAARLIVRLLLFSFLALAAHGQGVDPYPLARTDRNFQPKTPMSPPPVNAVFKDPDFGSTMVRVTDENTIPERRGGFFRNPAIGDTNVWSVDSRKFWVQSQGGSLLAFGFDPQTLLSEPLINKKSGERLVLPLRAGASFSYVDPDLVYGTSSGNFLAIKSYRFSSGITSTIIDTRTCGVQPALDPKSANGDDLSISKTDGRFAISEGGTSVDTNMFVIVYDGSLGCRWFNTQTGQIGGEWGPTGTASVAAHFSIHHVYLSKGGDYVRISQSGSSHVYLWDVRTLNITLCGPHCTGYMTQGYSHLINNPGLLDELDIRKRPISALTQITALVSPLKTPHQFGSEKHYSWNNVDPADSAPACFTTYRYDSNGQIYGLWNEEILCLETDGIASTIWRMGHHRASWGDYFQTQPLGNISPDGRFFLFTSAWDGQVGTTPQGQPRSDVWIVALQ